jgi:hypothetical protein
MVHETSVGYDPAVKEKSTQVKPRGKQRLAVPLAPLARVPVALNPAPLGSAQIHVAPFQPSPKESIMFSV